MPRIPYKNPAKGTSPVGDAIRERRGARGLTPLDQALLNAPEIAVSIARYVSHSNASALNHLIPHRRPDGTPSSGQSGTATRSPTTSANSWSALRLASLVGRLAKLIRQELAVVQILRVAARNSATFEWIRQSRLVSRNARCSPGLSDPLVLPALQTTLTSASTPVSPPRN